MLPPPTNNDARAMLAMLRRLERIKATYEEVKADGAAALKAQEAAQKTDSEDDDDYARSRKRRRRLWGETIDTKRVARYHSEITAKKQRLVAARALLRHTAPDLRHRAGHHSLLQQLLVLVGKCEALYDDIRLLCIRTEEQRHRPAPESTSPLSPPPSPPPPLSPPPPPPPLPLAPPPPPPPLRVEVKAVEEGGKETAVTEAGSPSRAPNNKKLGLGMSPITTPPPPPPPRTEVSEVGNEGNGPSRREKAHLETPPIQPDLQSSGNEMDSVDCRRPHKQEGAPSRLSPTQLEPSPPPPQPPGHRNHDHGYHDHHDRHTDDTRGLSENANRGTRGKTNCKNNGDRTPGGLRLSPAEDTDGKSTPSPAMRVVMVRAFHCPR